MNKKDNKKVVKKEVKKPAKKVKKITEEVRGHTCGTAVMTVISNGIKIEFSGAICALKAFQEMLTDKDITINSVSIKEGTKGVKVGVKATE